MSVICSTYSKESAVFMGLRSETNTTLAIHSISLQCNLEDLPSHLNSWIGHDCHTLPLCPGQDFSCSNSAYSNVTYMTFIHKLLELHIWFYVQYSRYVGFSAVNFSARSAGKWLTNWCWHVHKSTPNKTVLFIDLVMVLKIVLLCNDDS